MTTNMNADGMKVTDPFGRLIYQMERAMVNRLQRNFRSSGLNITAKQWRVLNSLWNQDGQTQQELAEKTQKDKGNMARLINGLEKQNYVVRIPNHADGRSKLIYLTQKGKEVQKELIPIAKTTLSEAQQNITERDLDLCKKVLQQALENLQR